MLSLRRHRLAYLRPEGWRALARRPWDTEALACLRHWAQQDLPAIVTVQRDARPDEVALGLPAPLCWGRRRLVLRVPALHIDRLAECPPLTALAARDHATWQSLADALAAQGTLPHVYGSHGWQHLTGLPYVHPASDLDMWAGVTDAAHADAVASHLQHAGAPLPRCDGELVFPDGSAVNWREWQAWRAGQARSLLVRQLDGVRLLPAGRTLGFSTSPQDCP